MADWRFNLFKIGKRKGRAGQLAGPGLVGINFLAYAKKLIHVSRTAYMKKPIFCKIIIKFTFRNENFKKFRGLATELLSIE